ncbi:RNA-guided endonuclease IscB, partial [Parasutterella excrementihominis]|nr:hypothetical protein [Parasutterella excrementihominis]
MPCSPAKARLLLKEKKAIVKRRTPFTIQLTIATGETKQPVSLGVDTGYKHVGLSASTEKAELYASEVELRQDITDLLSARRALRQSRRNRKTRYRAPRFDNRIRTKRKGWLAPSVENRINAHLSTPFTIQLTIATGETKQPVSLGVDAGYKHVGLSASTEKAELYASEVELRQDITDLLSARRALRQSRRNCKTRYRAPRFDNRIRTKRKGWLAPSVENRIDAHLSRIEAVLRLLPVTKITVETASFDMQLLKNPDISGKEYQEGEQLGFWNIREYVLCRDGHVCQHCYGRSKDPVLNVQHLKSRRMGGDSPGNLITLCETCHKALHRGEITLKAKRGQSFRAEAFMGIMRWEVQNRLKASHPELEVNNTYGYRTKHARIANDIAKSHCADAFCIAG